LICELIAHTAIVNHRAMADAGYVFHTEERVTDPDNLSEFAGRGCYESWGRPNPETATNRGYLHHILDVAHTSVLEHASATFYVAEVSRALLMELRTHRLLSFSALSQRYVDSASSNAIIPPALSRYGDAANLVREHQRDSVVRYESLVAQLSSKGLSRKEVREAARAVLPNSTETRFVVTGNMWAWHYVIGRRITPDADAEIRQLADSMLYQLREIAPNIFQDLH
jgi:thymidylate synthase (FAD)